MKRLFLVMSAAALVLNAPAGTAEELGKGVYHGSPSSPYTRPYQLEIQFELSIARYIGLFEGLRVDTLDVGRTFYATPQNTTDFNTVADYLTNGEFDFFCIGDGFSSNPGLLCQGEQDWFNLDTVDFAGFAVDTVTLYVNSLEFVDLGPGGLNAYSTYTFTVYGHPEVATERTTWGDVKCRYAVPGSAR